MATTVATEGSRANQGHQGACGGHFPQWHGGMDDTRSPTKSGQVPVSERMFAGCCDDVVGRVTLHGFGKGHTVQAPLVKVAVRVCGDERVEAVEIPLVCAVTDVSSSEYDVILPTDVVSKLKAAPVTVDVSCCDASVVSGEGSETPKVVTGEDTPEEVDKSVVGVEVCTTGRDVKDNDVVKIDDVLTSTPARVSCTVTSDRGEETEVTRFHPEPCRESITPLEESRDRFGDYTGRRDEDVLV